MALLKFWERVVSDPFGALSDWNYSHGESDHCSWFGVECSDGRIVILNLKDLCIGGTLAPELGKLTYVKSIILRNNSFYGNIPIEIGELKELEVLDLGYNNFTGPFPSDFGNNLSLSILLLDNNEFLGSISAELYDLKIVSESQVDENQLTSGSFEPSCKSRYGSWYALLNRNLRVCLVKVTISIKDGHFQPIFHLLLCLIANIFLWKQIPLDDHYIPSNSSKVSILNIFLHGIPWDGHTQPIQFLKKLEFLFTPPQETKFHGKYCTYFEEKSSWQLAFVLHKLCFSNYCLIHTKHQKIVNALFFESRIRPHEHYNCHFPWKPIDGYSISKTQHLLYPFSKFAIKNTLKVLVQKLLFSKMVTVKPWATGLSGQLQKAFVTGVPKLQRSELETACEDFSNIIGTLSDGTVYKGNLSSGVEIAVTSAAVKSAQDWSKNLETQFRNKEIVLQGSSKKQSLSHLKQGVMCGLGFWLQMWA